MYTAGLKLHGPLQASAGVLVFLAVHACTAPSKPAPVCLSSWLPTLIGFLHVPCS
jgi:hypothetical protein